VTPLTPSLIISRLAMSLPAPEVAPMPTPSVAPREKNEHLFLETNFRNNP
jgi:hypothetical protein